MSGTEVERDLFGGRLAESRRRHGLTQEELAGRLGVTPQALSKWERGSSFPDLGMLAEICGQLGTGADYLLGIAGGGITEDGDQKAQGEILKFLRGSLNPLQLLIGLELVPLFRDGGFVEKVGGKRRELAAEGILMPVLRIMDQMLLNPKEFMIVAYDNVLYHETLKELPENPDYIIGKLGEIVRSRYDEILNADILKQMTDNLRAEYPALITDIVPEKISYGLLLDVVRELIRRGDSTRYLPRIIEGLEHELREDGSRKASELAERVAARLEREDNYYVFMHRRRTGE
ncbi:MAG: FHIPEP family type III secretion protein [Roseburia sp.]|nr:FHIPEP family type III secretion protein [Roseburia sp.]MCM1097484.1 FHIPEP family type III secretion protein [Ruminococcus flavefaciens]